MGFAQPGQKGIKARSVVSEVLLQHLDIGLMPGIGTTALHQNYLNLTLLLDLYFSRSDQIFTFASGNCLRIMFHKVQAGWSTTTSTF